MEDLLCLEVLILENIDLLFKKCRGSAEIQAEGSLNLYEDILSFLLIYKAIKEGNILKDGQVSDLQSVKVICFLITGRKAKLNRESHFLAKLCGLWQPKPRGNILSQRSQLKLKWQHKSDAD